MSKRIENEAPAGPASAPNTEAWIDPEAQGVPWINPDIQQQVQWRDGDIVISVPVKSGTTWTMNIVHQLRSGGDPELDDIYRQVPWLELVPGPTATPGQLVQTIDAMPRDRRRAFKTHAAPGMLPYHPPGSGADVQYLVVMRHPDEVLASFYPFIHAHSDAWLALWGIERQAFVPPDIDTYFETFAKTMLPGGLFGFLSAWWPLRHQSNVLLLHFADMKRDHEGSVRRIADFLGFEPAAGQWPGILEYTSFPWMKQHEHKFEIPHAADVPILDSGAMIRKGRTGSAHEDGVTPAMSAELKSLGGEVLQDRQAIEWLYGGGAFH